MNTTKMWFHAQLKSDNFERTFWYHQILPKNELTNLKKPNSFVHFLEESEDTKKSFRNYLTFSNRQCDTNSKLSLESKEDRFFELPSGPSILSLGIIHVLRNHVLGFSDPPSPPFCDNVLSLLKVIKNCNFLIPPPFCDYVIHGWFKNSLWLE